MKQKVRNLKFEVKKLKQVSDCLIVVLVYLINEGKGRNRMIRIYNCKLTSIKYPKN